MSKKLAELTVRLAVDAKSLREWNAGSTEKERHSNRIAIMAKAGLSSQEQQAILEHDEAFINKALHQGVAMRLESFTNSVNTVIRVNTIEK